MLVIGCFLTAQTVWSEPVTNPPPPNATPTGTDFADFYHGQVPELTVAGGGDQDDDPATILSEPLAIKVGDGLQNAPVTYIVTSGEAQLTNRRGSEETPVTRLDVRAIEPIAKSPGDYAAQVYIHLPAQKGGVSTITAIARSGGQTKTVSTKVTASDPTVKPLVDFKIGANTATTADVKWTPADPKTATRIDIGYDRRATWKVVGTVPPGVTATTIYQIVPDQTISLRGASVKPDGKPTPERLIAPKR